MVEVTDKAAATDKSQASCEFSDSESWSSHQKEVTVKPVASRNSGNSESSKVGSRKRPHNFHSLQHQYLTWRKSTRSYDKVYGRSPTDELNDLDVNNAVSRYIHECHTSSRSSSWSRLLGESTIYQESAPEVSETVIPSDWQFDHGSDRNRWSDHDRIYRTDVEIDDSTMWQSDWDHDCQNLCLRRRGALIWEVSVTNQSKSGRTKSNGIWKIAISKIWIEVMESQWKSSGKYSRGFTTLGILEEIQKYMIELRVWTWAV